MASTPAKLPRSAALVGTPSSAPEPAAEAQVTANPLGAERKQEDEWEEQRSEEHGDRVYWVNKRTRESKWEKPRDLARDDNDDEWM